MRKLGRSPQKLEPLELFRRLDERSSGRINEGARIDAVMERASTGLRSALATPSTVHGWRAQSMFESLVVALDGCELLTTVDHGQIFHDGDVVKPPDLSIVLRNRRRLLVDVKSLPPTKVDGDVSVSANEWRGLRRFGELMDTEVYIGFLLSAFGMWTLVPLSLFPEPTDSRTGVSVETLLMANEMHLLGDLMLGVEPPLRMDLIADRSQPRPARLAGGELAEVQFTVGAVEFSVGGRPLTGQKEKDLAYFLLMFGGWDGDERVDVEHERFERMVFEVRPTEPASSQSFEIVGSLSQMYTRWFDLGTRDRDGNVTAFDTDVEPGMLPTLVPHDWESEEFPLWRFAVHPSSGTRRPGAVQSHDQG